MKVNLPIQIKEIKENKLLKHKENIEFDIDVSIGSQYRFEAKFPEMAKREDLLGYSERISAIEGISSAKILSELKLLYCWIDTEISFIDFVKLFDMSDANYVKDLTKELKNIFDLIFSSSSEKN